LGQKLEDNRQCDQNLKISIHPQPKRIIVKGIYHDDDKDPCRANDSDAKLCCRQG
jgi:hypothetical protein